MGRGTLRERIEMTARGPALALALAGATARGLVLALALAGAPAQAVVSNSGNGSGNATPPADDPGFANVGRTTNSRTGVYLGKSWVLTAAHVGVVAITLAGETYQPIAGTRVVLQSPGAPADLSLYRIAGFPPLPPVTIAQTPVAVSDEVVMIGGGWTREPGLTWWDDNFVEVPEPQAVYTGYVRASGGVVRWGRNSVDQIDDLIVSESIGTETQAFVTDFDPVGVADEAQTVPGDSGGAAFIKRGPDWELVGILVARETFLSAGQPNNTAVFGNESAIAEVADYADQILPVIEAPLPQISALPPPAIAVIVASLLATARRPLRRMGLRRAGRDGAGLRRRPQVSWSAGSAPIVSSATTSYQ